MNRSYDGAISNYEYYRERHMLLVRSLMGKTLLRQEIGVGISGCPSGDLAPCLVIGCIYFLSIEDFQKVFSGCGDKIFNDISNYTNMKPLIQVSDFDRFL
ncbi:MULTISPECIES: EthD family reductase [Oceanospirillaceae]|uniref:EthD family reductase n=1 Tax=Oceanobacter antarcticus TaxID=3133425 RepID=A0ABW8NHL6_9GAMM